MTLAKSDFALLFFRRQRMSEIRDSTAETMRHSKVRIGPVAYHPLEHCLAMFIATDPKRYQRIISPPE